MAPIEINGKVFDVRGPGDIHVTAKGQYAGKSYAVQPITSALWSGAFRRAPRVVEGERLTHFMWLSGGSSPAALLRESEARLILAAVEASRGELEEGRDAARRVEYAAQWRQAKTTGEPVVVNQWVEERERYESSQDVVCEFIRPDGTFFTRRSAAH